MLLEEEKKDGVFLNCQLFQETQIQQVANCDLFSRSRYILLISEIMLDEKYSDIVQNLP